MRRNKRVITPVGEIINSELFINWQNDKNEKKCNSESLSCWKQGYAENKKWTVSLSKKKITLIKIINENNHNINISYNININKPH